MSKTKIKLGDSFQKETTRIHLRRLFPFLKKEYRKLDSKELKKLDVLHELFGSDEKSLVKLKVVYEYQNI